MKFLFRFALMIVLIGAHVSVGNTDINNPYENKQILLIVDDSNSMNEIVSYPETPPTSKWNVLLKVYPGWLESLNSKTLVGALSVGGSCGSAPAIRLPVGTDKSMISRTIKASSPGGMTNLNMALEESLDLFSLNTEGMKKIVLLSDGMNSCPPKVSPCSIARQLYRDHGIIIDVVTWITDPKMLKELECIADITSGKLSTPRTFKEWNNLSIVSIDIWRYVLLASGIMTLFLASVVFYRHGFHVLGWSSRTATLAGGLLLGVGTLSLYSVLFLKIGKVGAFLGLLTIVIMVLAVIFRKNKALVLKGGGVLLVVLLAAPQGTFASDYSKRTFPRYHHILALDMSGSVFNHFYQMKSFIALYADKYIQPGETISLIAFGTDLAGSVRHISTFEVPDDGPTVTLTRLLDDLQIQNRKDTKTYFRPLADFLNAFLKDVKLDPIVVAVSDGKSDGLINAEKGKIKFKEIPFESLGGRGIYQAPGIKNWRVAIQGGNGLNLKELFKERIPLTGNKHQPKKPLGPVINPCLIEPQLIFESDERVILRPTFNPLSNWRNGMLRIKVRNRCVNRFRSFDVVLLYKNKVFTLGKVENQLIGPDARFYTFPISMEEFTDKKTEAAIKILLDQGETLRTIYGKSPPSVTFEKVGYFAAYWTYFLLVGGILLLCSSIFVVILRRKKYKAQNDPIFIKSSIGVTVPIYPNLEPGITVGGEGNDIELPSAPPGLTMGYISYYSYNGRKDLKVRTAQDFQLKIGGKTLDFHPDGEVLYHLGQPLEFVYKKDGSIYNTTLYAGSKKRILISNLSSDPYPNNFEQDPFNRAGSVINGRTDDRAKFFSSPHDQKNARII